MHFPDQYFVAMQSYAGDGGKYPLGYPVPDGSDAAARKRISSSKVWAGNACKTLSFKNEPTEGFRIIGDVKRDGGWFSNGNVVWRVEDPRGFEFEITSPNLAMLLSLTTVESGLIKGKCLFARDGSKNAIVLENSDEYKATQAQTDRIKATKSFSLRDAKVGDVVKDVNGVLKIYFGKVWLIVETKNDVNDRQYRNRSYSESRYVSEVLIKERYLLVNARQHQVNPSNAFMELGTTFDFESSPKIAGIVDKTSLSFDDAYATIRGRLGNISVGAGSHARVLAVSPKKITEADFTISF